MTYSTSNAPFITLAAVAGGWIGGSTNTVGNQWAYKSTDPVSTVIGSSYFSNGVALGMRVADAMMVYDTTNTAATWCFVSAVSSLSTGGATVAKFSTGS